MSTWIDTLPADKAASVERVIAEHGDALMKRHCTDDAKFAFWLELLNRAVQRRVMLSYDDLEDWDYWSNYEAGMAPNEAAVQMLHDNDFMFEGSEEF